MRRFGTIVLIVALVAQAALAEAPDRSIRPQTRTGAAPSAAAPALPDAGAAPSAPGMTPIMTKTVVVPHPRPRPAGLATRAATPAAVSFDPRVTRSRPRARPSGLSPVQEAVVAVAASAPVVEPQVSKKKERPRKEKKTKKGSVCGDSAIRGEKLAPITSRVRGCGVEEPVRVTSIDGIQFSQPATIDCQTAQAFKTWINQGMRPAFGNREVVGLHIFGSYMCRSRNNVRGARISEHGRGKAIDVAGFVFSDGKEWTVKDNYNKQIRKAQKAACGIFGTTLGPGSDGYHEDHLHFDTASYGNGPYCR